MLVYLLVFLVATLIAYFAENFGIANSQKRLPRPFSLSAVLVASVLAGVAALRWEVGTDYKAYVSLFSDYVDEVEAGELTLLGEPGLRIIAWISAKVGGDSAVMFAIVAVVITGLFLRTLWRWSPAFGFSIAIFIVSGVWHETFNGIRQYLAAAILFAGHRFIIQRQGLKWVLVVLLAMLFHVTAIICIFLYLLPVNKTTPKIQLAILAGGCIGMFGMSEILAILETYTNDTGLTGEYATRSIHPLRIAFAFVPIILFWFLSVKDYIRSEKAWFYVNVLVVYAAIYLAASGSALIARFAIYLAPYLALSLIYVTGLNSQTERKFIRSILVLLYALFMYAELQASPDLQDFKWIFERP